MSDRRKRAAAIVVLLAGMGIVLYGAFYHPFGSNSASLPGSTGGGSAVQSVNGTNTINPPPNPAPNPSPNPPPIIKWHGMNGWCHGNGNKHGIKMKAAQLNITLPTC